MTVNNKKNFIEIVNPIRLSPIYFLIQSGYGHETWYEYST